MLAKDKNDYLTINEYLDFLNQNITGFNARIIGEITEVSLYPGRNYLFFKIKDKDNPAVLNGFMWKTAYVQSGVNLEVGLEVIISGNPNVFKPLGRLSFQTQTIELVGEGALKKAYDELKAKLTKEGLFNEDRKRKLPAFPQKIGLITSKDGAAIGDFQVNLGNFGFKIMLADSRVEGQLAVAEILSAIHTLKKKKIDVLVLIRGGGSLESLLPFNNEILVREIASFPVPVLVGVGHEKDISLIGLVADKMVSTPTMAAQTLNQPWRDAIHLVDKYQAKIFDKFENNLIEASNNLNELFDHIGDKLKLIFDRFNYAKESLRRSFVQISNKIFQLDRDIDEDFSRVERGMKILIKRYQEAIFSWLSPSLSRLDNVLTRQEDQVVTAERILASSNPERQLKLGYSIIRVDGTVVRKIAQIKKGQIIEARLEDGSFQSEVKNING